MTLGYSQKFPWGEQTFFKQKILISQSVPLGEWMTWEEYDNADNLLWYKDIKPKPHTIRGDEKDRWREGMKIHHCYGNRTKERECFLVNTCVSIQRIHIFTTKTIGTNVKGEDLVVGSAPMVMIDGRVMDSETVERLAINDGFQSVEEFFKWFNHDFTGKIIHWTKLRY